MIVRSDDATFLNYVANHPEVRPWLGKDVHGRDDSALNFQPLIDSGGAFILAEPTAGGFLIIYLGDGDYECHTMFLPEHRGTVAFQAACEAADYIFTATDCERLYTQLPEGNPAPALLARRVGFAIVEPRQSAWRDNGGVGDDALLTKEVWSERRAKLAALTMAPLKEPQCPPPPLEQPQP